MVHDLSQYAFELPDIEEWLAGDDRKLEFFVVDAAGNSVDISSATPSWALYGREYQTEDSDAVLTDSDSGVEVVTDSRVDTSVGEWEVRIDGSATSDLYGEYYHRPAVEQSDGTVSKWRGRVVLTA